MRSCIHTFSPPRHGGGSGETHHRLFCSRSLLSVGMSPAPARGWRLSLADGCTQGADDRVLGGELARALARRRGDGGRGVGAIAPPRGPGCVCAAGLAHSSQCSMIMTRTQDTMIGHVGESQSVACDVPAQYPRSRPRQCRACCAAIATSGSRSTRALTAPNSCRWMDSWTTLTTMRAMRRSRSLVQPLRRQTATVAVAAVVVTAPLMMRLVAEAAALAMMWLALQPPRDLERA
eukprot:SAG25_NODE_646_length_6216_cov_14.594736_5_plen_234_part_00